MTSPKFESFRSRYYEIIVHRFYGYFYIQQRATGTTTLLFTGSEGLKDYQILKASWRKSRRNFNSLCAEYRYS